MAKKKNRLRAVAAKSANDSDTSRNFTRFEASVLGLTKESGIESPYVNLKYYSPDRECISTWSTEELKSFSQFCTKIRQMTWPDIYRSGGSVGHKTGLGYTPHKDVKKLPENAELKNLSQDITWFELRITEKVRVHGFRATDAFFLVYLDREHSIYSM